MQQSHCYFAIFAIVILIINPAKGKAVEDRNRLLKRNAVFDHIRDVLLLIPVKLHGYTTFVSFVAIREIVLQFVRHDNSRETDIFLVLFQWAG